MIGMITSRRRAALAGALVGLALLALTNVPAFAQPSSPVPSGAVTHEQMHQMMDAVHGPGTSERMHQAMGPDAERLMDQCVGMMGMMQNMQGMMNGDMSSMMGGQNGQSMQEMMNQMMGR